MTDRELDILIAEMMGWRWVSFIDIPVRGTPGYPQECRVRRFFPPETLADEEWKSYLQKHDARDATGDEPLHYAYCSSMGPAFPLSPSTSAGDDYQVLQWVRENWEPEKLTDGSWISFQCKVASCGWMYTPGDWSRAALAVWEASKE